MNFIDDIHKDNFDLVKTKWKSINEGNKEYAATGYILAAPIIFEKLTIIWSEFETPVEWIYDWEMKNNPSFHYTLTMSDEEKSNIQIDYDLTHSMVELGRLALHLWNNTPFSLLESLGCLDEKNYNLAINAILIRTKK